MHLPTDNDIEHFKENIINNKRKEDFIILDTDICDLIDKKIENVLLKINKKRQITIPIKRLSHNNHYKFGSQEIHVIVAGDIIKVKISSDTIIPLENFIELNLGLEENRLKRERSTLFIKYIL